MYKLITSQFYLLGAEGRTEFPRTNEELLILCRSIIPQINKEQIELIKSDLLLSFTQGQLHSYKYFQEMEDIRLSTEEFKS